MSLVVILVVVFGVEKGICWLFNLNIVLFSLLLLFVLVCGLILELFNGFVQNFGDYFDGLVLKIFDFYVYIGVGVGKSEEWLGLWILFYWVWWIFWVFFVGMFIVCIFCGCSVCELVCGVLLILLGFILVWLLVFGNSVLDLVMNYGVIDLGKVVLEQLLMLIYLLLEYYLLLKIVIGLLIFVGFVLFFILVDFGLVMLVNFLCSGGELDEDVLNWLCIFWLVVVMLVIIGLLFVGNFMVM